MASFRNGYLLLSAMLAVGPAYADSEIERGLICRGAVADGEDTADPQPRRYAPDRKVDVLHLKLDVTPDFEQSTVAGTTTLTFVPIGHALREMRLDAIDLSISSVESSAPIAAYQVTDREIIVTFQSAIPVGGETTVTIAHEAEPHEVGMYFRTPATGYPGNDPHLFTQGEAHENPHWFPSFDYPNERFTSEVICRVPPDMVAISNGRLVSEAEDAATGLKAFHWLQEEPHVNYLIALVAGRMSVIEERYRDIELSFYAPTSQIELAPNSFEETADMMAFLEQEIGVPYPWFDYKQAAVDGFPWGGMENTTLTILTTRTFFTDAVENIRSSRDLIAHELAHQWFGDYLTCKDWAHLWLNEGFATHYGRLYQGRHSRDHMLYDVYRDNRHIVAQKDRLPIVQRVYADVEEDLVSYRVYSKGAWVLRMLAVQLGDDLFRRCIKTYVQRNALRSVVTEDLNRVIEELSGRSYDQFFDQWVYHGGHPELEVTYSWDETEKLAKVSVTQTQALGDSVLLFALSTKIRFKTGDSVEDHAVEIASQHHDFYFHLAEKPDIVRFDPEYGVLAEVEFEKPTDMLYAQLADQEDVVGRLRAVEALKDKSDKKTVERLKTALQEDVFFGVRIEASAALREIHTPEAFQALASSMSQPDARVRKRVVADVGGFFRDDSLQKSQHVLEEEHNPVIVAQAIRNLGRYPGTDTKKALLSYLKSASFRNRLAVAAVSAIRQLDDPAYSKALRKTLASGKASFPPTKFGTALGTLAYIARNQDDRDAEREFLLGYVNDRNREIQIAAIGALGTLRDPRAIPAVQTFASPNGTDKDPVQKAAASALKRLRDSRTIPIELSELRQEVLDLKEDNEVLREDLDDLTKRFEAKEEAGDDGETGGESEGDGE